MKAHIKIVQDRDTEAGTMMLHIGEGRLSLSRKMYELLRQVGKRKEGKSRKEERVRPKSER